MPQLRILEDENRLIYFADTGLNAYNLWDPVSVDQFARHMDDFADNGVDTYSQLTFAAGSLKPGLFIPKHPEFSWWTNEKIRPLIESGVQPLEVMIDQAHSRGMKFFCKLRLTDWHMLRSVEESGFIARHPEFQNPDNQIRKTLDFSHSEVHDYHSALILELVRTFDIDGITLNFTRGLAYFPKAVKVDRKAILTEFVRKIRTLLQHHNEEKGTKVQLNVIVWPHLKLCASYGLNIPAWIKEGLIDQICPGNTSVTDPNMDHEAWSSLCHRFKCGYYPMLQPSLWREDRLALVESDHLRALAKSMYDGGADGISVFNWQFHWDIRGGRGPSGVTHGPWSYPNVVDTSEVDYPLALVKLRQLRDPNGLDREPRKYYFRPMEIKDNHSYEVFEDSYRVVFPRTVGARGEYCFRLPENLPQTGGAYLVARILGLAPLKELGGDMTVNSRAAVSGPEIFSKWMDEIVVDLNGLVVPTETIQKAWHKDGRPKAYGRHLDPYTSIWFKLESPPVNHGQNILGISMVKLEPFDSREVVIEELEIAVMPGPIASRN